MDQEIASAINRELFHQQAAAQILIMNARRYAKGAITAITHQNATAPMTMQYRDMIMTTASNIDKGVVEVEDNESGEILMIHPVPCVQYMGKGTEVLEKMREEFEAQDECVTIPAKVPWLANHSTFMVRRHNGEIATLSVVFS